MDEEAIEAIIRPIVEGQIRGFIKEHPSILTGVTWYKPRTDKAKTLMGSLSKRITRDLLCETNLVRLERAFLARRTEAPDEKPSGIVSARRGSWLASFLARIFHPWGW